jgi:ABC-2 type transport system permease protein
MSGAMTGRLLALEVRRVLRSPGVLLAGFIVLALAVHAAWSGRGGVETLNAAVELSRASHEAQLERLLPRYTETTEAGEPLYYVAFPAGTTHSEWAALFQGQRDVLPWNLQLRLLALEGQLYDSELGNPLSLASGPLDLSFILLVLLPLVAVALNHDLLSGEREGGTWSLSRLQAGSASRALGVKILARGGIFLALTGAILAVGVGVAGAPVDASLAAAALLVGMHALVWFMVTLAVALGRRSSSMNAMILAGLWVLAVSAGPALLNLVNGVLHPMPQALELTVLQREGYHASWDRPVQETMVRYYEDYPHLAEAEVPGEGFSWAWYYAMNHRGDQEARESALAYREGLRAREGWARRWSALFPPVAAQLALDRIAGTDLSAHLRYHEAVRGHHEVLKAHFQPMIFSAAPLSAVDWGKVPAFAPPAVEPAGIPSVYGPFFLLVGWLLVSLAAVINALRRVSRE